MTELVVRPRTDTDLSALGEILTAVHAADGYPIEGVADPEAWLLSPRTLAAWVAALRTGPIGHVMLTAPGADDAAANIWLEHHHGSPSGVAVVGRLFVAPDGRGHHAGRELMNTAVAQARILGRQAVLDVLNKDTTAIRLYEQLGWHSLGPSSHQHSGLAEPATAYVAGPETSDRP